MISYDFFESHQTIIKLSPENAVDFILTHTHPKELVQSFSEESFYFFITSVGINNEIIPIISLASEKQWEYLLDVEIWNKDLLDYFSITNLLMLMMEAGSQRFIQWCFHEKKDFMELYLFRNINIKILDENEDYSNLDNNFFTNDGVFYISIINYNTSHQHELSFLEKRNVTIKEILLRFSNIDYVRYQNLLMETMNIIPAELEEELFKMKSVRLAEKGFLPFHEAIGIYQPIKFKDIKKKGRKVLKLSKNESSDQLIPYLPIDMLRKKNLFSLALENICDNVILQQLRIELGSLCNLVISADNKKIRSYNDLKAIIDKTNNFLNIGIEFIISNYAKHNIMTPSDIVENWCFYDIFRLGYSQIFNLSQRVKNWYNDSWFISQNLKLPFWGEYWFGVLGGLLLDKPMFFNRLNLSYRDFREYNEVYEIEEIISQIILVDNTLNHFNLEMSIFSSKYLINANNLLLNIWFLYTTGINKRNLDFYPIPLEEFKSSYDQLWENINGKRQIKETKKNNLFILIANKMNLETDNLPRRTVLLINKLFKKLENELSDVTSKDLDPRYIELFVIDDMLVDY